MAHEDYCRVCHQSGEVLCCDGCTAVFHLHCLNPPLSSIPTTSWICPVCIKKRTPGVTDCLSEAEKNGVAHYQEPIGKDRAGRLYWYISRRLIIEPVDFTQREPELMGFHDGVVDKLWESEYGHELAENDPEVKDGNDEDDDDVDDSITNRNDNDINSSSKVSGSDNLSVSVKRSLKRKNKKYQCDPSISYANEPRVYYYSSIEQVMRIRESLSTDWEPWLCHRLDALLPKMRNEMAITQKLTENGLQQFCRSRPNHKSISVNDPVQSYNTMPVTNTVYVYSVLEVEQASCEKSTLLKHDNEICDYPKKKLAIAACSLPSMDAPVFPTLPNELPSVMEKCSEDFPTILLVTDQNNCVIRNHDGVVNCTTRDNSNDVATYPPTILEPHELSTLHMTVDSSPSNSSEGLLAYRLSDEGSWRSWTNLYTSGVWIGQESITDEKLEDGLNELKRTPSGTRNSNPQNTTGEVDGDEITSESVNVALTRAQHMEEKEKRRLLTNKFNFSELSSDLWQYIDPASLASTYKGILRFMDNKIELSKFPAFERIRFDCWPASPYQLLDLLRLTLCYMESKIPLAFLTPAWRTHRADWIKDVLDSKSPSELAFVLARLEASIRSVCFQRVWFSSLGHLNLERMTAAQREEDKRLRQFDRFSSTASGTANSANLPTTLIRTKTPHPIRHTVWKTRGEEYRRLGGDGWIWLSSTRSNASQMAQHALLIRPPVSSWRQSDVVELPCGITSRSTVHHPADCREYLQGQTAVKPPKASECRGHVLHPITGIPLYLNPKRTPYTIPPNVLRNLNAQISESCTDYQTNSSQTHDKKENVITSTSVAIKNEESINNVTTIEKKEGDQLDSTKGAESKKVEVKVEQKELLLGQVTSNKSNNNKNKLEEDANPVLNVSYCISNRIHFPPAVHQPQTTYSHTSSSRRLHFRLDSLLKHRYIAAENDKKAGLAASNAVNKLVKEIEELEKRHSEIMGRLTNLGNEAQQARTAKAQAVKAKQNALLAKPLPVEYARNPHMNQSSEHGNTAVGRQLIQQSVLTDQGVCYRVLAPRNVPNMQINQFAYNPARRTTNIPSRSSNSHPSRRPRARRGSDFSNSDSDSDSFPASARRMDTSNKESLPVRRSARRVRTVRHDPDFVVDFDEDDEDDDRNKADDSDGFDPSDETRGRHGGQKRSQVSVHLNARTSGRGIPQYDGVGDTSDEDIGYDDDDDDDYDNEYDELEEDEIVEEDYDDEVVEDYGDEIVEDEEIEEEEDEQEEEDEIEEDECFPVTSGKRIRLAPQVMEKMSKVSVHHSGQSPNPSTVCTTPKVVILKNNTTPNMQGNNNKARILSIPATGGQRIILPAKMNGPNSGRIQLLG
ncbi:unnamed protein product [Heterobilharzia americana]|nr:unnamed protein product [Heterobilharzia americana]